MKPPLAPLVLLLAALLAADAVLARRDGEAGARAATIRRLVPADEAAAATVAGLSIEGPGGRFAYARRDGVWRCVNASNAVAMETEVAAVAGDLLEAVGELRADDAGRVADYGLAPDRSRATVLRVHGQGMFDPDRDGDVLIAFELGARLPGGRSFVRPATADEVWEIQRDPRALLDRAQDDRLPPLLDRRVLAAEWPSPQEGIVRAFVDSAAGSLELRLGEQGFTVIEDGESARCLTFRAMAWQAFLFRVPYLGFAEPAAATGLDGPDVTRITLFQTRASPIELTVGRPRPDGSAFVHNGKTGMACLVAAEHVPLFAPSVDRLTDERDANPWEAWLRR